jgi:DNA-binding CsgD family transcriptional regulator
MKEIGAALGISPRTVETHRERLMSKLGVTNAAGLTRMAVVVGVLHPRASGKSRTRSPDTD